jgi:hypothetical protein
LQAIAIGEKNEKSKCFFKFEQKQNCMWS